MLIATCRCGSVNAELSQHALPCLFAMWRLDRLVCTQTRSKFMREQKFCVTACVPTSTRLLQSDCGLLTTVSSRFSTACHQPPGTKIVSPGCWMNSIIPNSCGYTPSLDHTNTRRRHQYTYVLLQFLSCSDPGDNIDEPGCRCVEHQE